MKKIALIYLLLIVEITFVPMFGALYEMKQDRAYLIGLIIMLCVCAITSWGSLLIFKEKHNENRK